MLDEQVTRSILYRECISLKANGQHFRISQAVMPFSDDCVFVELRQIGEDIVLERVVVVDGAWTVDSLTAYRASEHDVSNLQRMAIQVYDTLVALHPLMKALSPLDA